LRFVGETDRAGPEPGHIVSGCRFGNTGRVVGCAPAGLGNEFDCCALVRVGFG
jgi:hypothetical protein